MSDNTQDVLTRKKVLKRAAGGAAIVWAAPLVLSDVASAGVDASKTARRCVDLARATGVACRNGCDGVGEGPCSADGCCFCTMLTNGCCDCLAWCEGQSCDSPPCTKKRDCPRGFACADAVCCGGAVGRCLPLCTRPAGASSPTGAVGFAR